MNPCHIYLQMTLEYCGFVDNTIAIIRHLDPKNTVQTHCQVSRKLLNNRNPIIPRYRCTAYKINTIFVNNLFSFHCYSNSVFLLFNIQLRRELRDTIRNGIKWLIKIWRYHTVWTRHYYRTCWGTADDEFTMETVWRAIFSMTIFIHPLLFAREVHREIFVVDNAVY